MSSTTRFGLPLLAAGQAQKEMFHNEALVQIDGLLHACAEASGLNTPPAEPQLGQMWIIGSEPSGAWQDAAGHLAQWTEGGWRFTAPQEGMQVSMRDTGFIAVHRAGEWQIGIVAAQELRVAGQRVVTARQPPIAEPTGGTVIDQESRNAIMDLLAAMRSHGLIST